MALSLAMAGQALAVNPSSNVTSGSFGDLTWEARSLIVGMTPTAGGAGPRYPEVGDSIFAANTPFYSGVIPIIITRSDGNYICTASLLSDRRSLLTAAHCATGAISTTAFFFENQSPTDRPPTDPGSTPISISQVFMHPLYTGQVIDQNDIAILRLSDAAPSWATSYNLAFSTDLKGMSFNVAGYGNRSLVGGGGASGGTTAGTTGYLRQGDNMFDFRFGDAVFGTNWGTILGAPMSRIEYSYISDFDNGLALNDQSCRVTQASNFGGLPGTQFCDLGRGATEVSVAGGDSGGPQFNSLGQIVSLTSFGLSFGTTFGDCRSGLQSSCGELNGFVPLFIHQDFIASAMVPEPASYGLMALGLIAVGGMVRKRRLG